MQEETKKMNIYQKLVEVRKAVPYLQKDTEGYKYKYVSGSSVISSIKDKMNELGVLLVPIITEYEVKDTGKKVSIDGKMTMVWVNAENPEDKLEVPFALFGSQDDISKAFGSALTYSERYFFLKFFNIATDVDDPDTRQGTPPSRTNATSPKNTEEAARLMYVSEQFEKQKSLDGLIATRDMLMGKIQKLSASSQVEALKKYKSIKAKLEMESIPQTKETK